MVELEPPPFAFPDAPASLRWDDGVVRVGKSRVSLDLVVEQYENGMTPEDTVRAYDALALADVYEVVAYYLRHRTDVQGYMTHRRREADALRAKIEAERPPVTRQELLARKSAAEGAGVPAGQ